MVESAIWQCRQQGKCLLCTRSLAVAASLPLLLDNSHVMSPASSFSTPFTNNWTLSSSSTIRYLPPERSSMPSLYLCVRQQTIYCAAPAFDFYAARQVCRKAVMNGVVIFYQTPILLHRTAAAHQMYTTGSTYSILDLPIWHSPQPSANFYRRSKSAKIWPRFWRRSTLSRCRFEKA